MVQDEVHERTVKLRCRAYLGFVSPLFPIQNNARTMHLDPSEALNFFNAVRIRYALFYLYILVIRISGGGHIPNGDSQQCWVKLLR